MPSLNALAGLPPSATMSAAGGTTSHPDPILLSIGEPLEPPPPEAFEAAHQSLRDGATRYGPPAGLPQLREGIAAANGPRLTADQVIVTAGGKPALLDSLRCLLEPDDEVIVLAPYWSSFLQQIEWCGAKPVIVRATTDGTLDTNALEAACTSRTRVIIVNSPVNPSAEVVPATALDAVFALAQRRDLWILSDEVYRHLAFDAPAPSFLEVDRDLSRCIVVTSFSKRYSLTGLRVGAAIAAPKNIEALTRLMMTSQTHASMPAQYAALGALRSATSWETERLQNYQTKRDFAVDRLQAIQGVSCRVPGAALYLFPDCSELIHDCGLQDDVELCRRLREEAGLFLVAGSAFGAPGFVRVSYGVGQDRLSLALDRWDAWALANRQA